MFEVERSQGNLALSMGTSMAIEGLLGLHPNQPEYPPEIARLTQLWVNLRTLIRNYVAALETKEYLKVSPPKIAHDLQLELEFLQTLPSGGWAVPFTLTEVVVYDFEDSEFLRHWPGTTPRVASTQQQIHRRTLESGLRRLLHERLPHLPSLYRLPPLSRTSTTALLTHLPHELWWLNRDRNLLLLESHTGRLKSQHSWNSKLNSKYTGMPFNGFTLQLYGDSEVITRHPRRLLNELERIAEQRGWTVVTPETTMMKDLRQYASTELRDVLAKLAYRRKEI